MRRTTKWVVATGLVLAACGAPPPSADGVAPVRAPALPFDPATMVERIELAFRPDEGRFTARHETHLVVVDGRALRVHPVLPTGQTATIATPLTVSTASIARGDDTLAIGGEPRLDERGRVVRSTPAIDEIVATRGDGAELSWRLPERPAGQGDLEVRLLASGMEPAGVTAGGAHFRDPATGIGVRVGHATWIDASARRTDVAVELDGMHVVMRVPASVLESSSYPAVLDPVVGPETAVDVPIVGTGSGGRSEPSIAWSGSGYLIAWLDRRNPPLPQVWAARVSAAGALLDAGGLLVSNASALAERPSAVFDGTDFAVYYGEGGRVVGRRIPIAGAVLPGELVLSTTGGQAWASQNGATTLVVWSDTRNASTTRDIYAARVSGGTVVGAGAFPISTAAGSQTVPRVTSSATTWLATWQTGSYTSGTVHAARISASTGALLDATPIALGVGEAPFAASDGTDFLVAWHDWNVNSGDSFAVRVSAAGAVLDSPRIALCNASTQQFRPSIAFLGGSYLVIWEDGRGGGVYGNRISPAGAVLDGATGRLVTSVPFRADTPMVVTAGTRFYLAWSASNGGEDGQPSIRGARLSSALTLEDSPPITLSASANGQRRARIASNGTDFLVVWEDDRAEATSIYAQRMSGATGAPIGTAVLVSAGGVYESTPAAAWNGSRWLVAWRDNRGPYGLWGARVEASGALVDATPLPLYAVTSGFQPGELDLAPDGAGWILTWDQYNGSNQDVRAGRVDASGSPTDGAGFAVSAATGNQSTPAITAGGPGHLVLWADTRSGSYSLYGARLSGSTVLDPSGVQIDPTAPVFPRSYGAAYVAPDFVIAYPGAGNQLTRARMTASTGSIADVLALGATGLYPRIAFDGTRASLVYMVGANVWGTRLLPTGADADATDWLVGGTTDTLAPSIAAVPGRAMVTYSAYDGSAGVRSVRVVTRTVDGDPNGAACTSGATCGSGICVDGVCCNVACGGGATDDCEACSVARGAAVNGTCAPIAAGTVCRASGGPCDVAEACDGAGAACPADGVAVAGTVCDPDVGTCDPDDVCDGSAKTCAELYASATTTCRAAGGACDVAETCDGAGACPADTFAGAGTGCRAAAGPCDIAEACTGTSAACPTDAFASAATECRASAGPCDLAESCTGGAAACPSDAVATAGTVCDLDVGTCDPSDVCDGSTTGCAEIYASATTECRASASVCDVAETCDGAGACPGDAFAAATVQCRASAGVCDVAESCTGTGAACPSDAFAAATVECRASAGVCDVAESCTGSAAACPSDGFASAATECRASAGPCDLAESCTGGAAACPSDAVATAGTVCDPDVGTCDPSDVCDGSTTGCAETYASATTECRASAGVCDVAETCDGAGACPGDTVAPTTTVCRPAVGPCDLGETCTGAGVDCPSDGVASAGTICDPDVGVCDPSDVCDGSTTGCAETFASATTECRAAAGNCDVAETCDGAGACPGDALAAATVECRAAVGECDVAESCTGSSADCPSDAAQPEGTTCGAAPAGDCDTADQCTGIVGAIAACEARFASAGTPCRDASCDLGIATRAAACTGDAAACPVPDTLACAPYPCGADACLATCTSDDGCDADHHCNAAGACAPDLGLATACDRDVQCASGQCVDGVCCDAACDGQCEACDVAGSEGTCSAVSGAPHGARAACDGSGTCAGACDGTERAACVYPGASSACDPSCSDGLASIGACDGLGACGTPATTDCAPYACGADACLTTCATSDDCIAGHTCEGDACVAISDGGVIDAGVLDDGGTLDDGGAFDDGAVPDDASIDDDAAVGADGGRADGSADAGAPPPATGGCGCTVPARPRSLPLGSLALGLALAILVRRHR